MLCFFKYENDLCTMPKALFLKDFCQNIKSLNNSSCSGALKPKFIFLKKGPAKLHYYFLSFIFTIFYNTWCESQLHNLELYCYKKEVCMYFII